MKIKDEWRTPPYVFRWAAERFTKKGFIIDLAATKDNALCTHFLKKGVKDGLKTSWSGWCDLGDTGWCNPPYSSIGPWISKAIIEAEKGFNTVMLLPSLNGEIREGAILRHASHLVFITGGYRVSGRISFLSPIDGKAVNGNGRGSMLVRFGFAPHPTPQFEYIPRITMMLDS